MTIEDSLTAHSYVKFPKSNDNPGEVTIYKFTQSGKEAYNPKVSMQENLQMLHEGIHYNIEKIPYVAYWINER